MTPIDSSARDDAQLLLGHPAVVVAMSSVVRSDEGRRSLFQDGRAWQQSQCAVVDELVVVGGFGRVIWRSFFLPVKKTVYNPACLASAKMDVPWRNPFGQVIVPVHAMLRGQVPAAWNYARAA